MFLRNRASLSDKAFVRLTSSLLATTNSAARFSFSWFGEFNSLLALTNSDARFSFSWLNYLKANTKMYEQMRYCIIEKSPLMQEQERKQVPDQVGWYNSISEIGEVTGCVLSNELVDNFAVHRVVMQNELMEVYVDYQDGFTEVLQPARLELRDYFAELGICLARGYATEINLEALDWIGEVASALKNGYVMTIDYGCRNPAMYKASRSQGTLVCYYKHSVNDSFYAHIGEQDMTTHVNFSALSHWGEKNGLIETSFTDQGCFLSSLGFRDQLLKSLSGESDVIRAAHKASSLSHILLIDMGSKYKVLIQQKGVQGGKLSGLSDHSSPLQDVYREKLNNYY